MGMANMKVAISGFGPFGGDDYNPTASLVRSLCDRDDDLSGHVFEVARDGVDRELWPWLDEVRPDVLISLGLAGGRTALAVEAVAINRQEFRIPDVQGLVPDPGAIQPGGPTAFASGLNVDQVLDTWRRASVPGYISYSAGTYLCNYLFYQACSWASTHGGRVAFIHVPYSTVYVPHPERHPSMEESRMTLGIHAVVEALRVGQL